MSYKCLECGNIFDEGEQMVLDIPLAKKSGCPMCFGDYEETKPCKICGSKHLEDELNNGVCDECIEKYRYDIDMCFKIGSEDVDEVKLNCFLSLMFDKKEIEAILFRELKEEQKYRQIDCEKFIESNRNWFAERIEEEVNKDENTKG